MNCRYDDEENDDDFDDKEESDSEVVEAAEAVDTIESENVVTKTSRNHFVQTLKWLSSLHSGPYRLRPTRG